MYSIDSSGIQDAVAHKQLNKKYQTQIMPENGASMDYRLFHQ